MDETSLRAQLELAVSDEPPLGHLVGNSVRAGRRLRHRRQAAGAASISAAAIVVIGVVPAFTAGTSPRPGRSHPAVTEHRAEARGSRRRPYSPIGAAAYVAAGRAVVPISLATNMPGRPIRVPEGVGDGPFVTNAASSPDGRIIYEVGFDGGSGSTVTPIDTTTSTVGPVITVSNAADAQQFAVAPNGKTAYLSATQGLFRISFATNTASKLTGCSQCGYEAIAFTPNAKTLYAITSGARTDTVTAVRTASNTALARITLPAPENTTHFRSFARQIAITPNGKTAYVLFSPAGAQPGDTTVVPISVATNTPLTPIKISAPGFADNLAITPDGRTAFVLSTRAVTAIDTATNQAESTISLPESAGNAYYMELAPNGQRLYVLTPGGVVPIRTANGAVLPTIKVPGLYTFSVMAITPDSRTIYVGANITKGSRKVGGLRMPIVVARGVVPISTTTGTAGHFINLGTDANAISFAP
jgi:hypothetical protein